MKSVLLISDRSDMVQELKRLLSQEYSVFVTGKAEALEFLSTALADVAIVDLFERKGLSLLKEIRERPLRCGGLIGLMPSDADISDEEEDLLRRCDSLLKEPLSRPEVQAAVKGTMEKQRLLQEVRSLQSQVPPIPQKPSLNHSAPPLEQVLKGFAKSLSARLSGMKTPSDWLNWPSIAVERVNFSNWNRATPLRYWPFDTVTHREASIVRISSNTDCLVRIPYSLHRSCSREYRSLGMGSASLANALRSSSTAQG